MNLTELRFYLLAKKGTTEEMPFGPDNWVYKVVGKMFALVTLDADPLAISLKCEPGQALLLRDVYPAVQPGYHMNKTHWNTIFISQEITEKQIKEWIKHSYDLVKAKLPKIKHP